MDELTSVSELLQRSELVQYANAFEEQGYDSLAQLRGITEADLADLIRDVNMKKGHVKRLRAALGKPEGAASNMSSASAEPAAAEPVGAPPQPATQEPANAQHVSVMPPPATNHAAQAVLYKKLVEIDALGHMVHGNIIETYKAPSEMGGELMITDREDSLNRWPILLVFVVEH